MRKKAPPPAQADTQQAAALPAPAARARRKWRRRLAIALVVLLALVVVLRIAISLSLPAVLHKVAAQYGLQCTYERSELAMLDGDFGIWHLELRPAEGGEPLLYAEYCRGDLSTLALLRGRLEVWRLEADGVDLAVHRTAEGRVPLLERFLAGSQVAAPAAVPAGQPATEARKPSLASPLKVDAFRVSHLRLRLKDDAVRPALDTTVQLDLRASDIGSTVRPTRIEVGLAAEGILRSLRLSAERRGTDDHADADVRLAVHGLDPRPLEGFLRPLGLHPVAGDISLRMRAAAKVSLTAQSALAGQVRLEDVAVVADGAEVASVGRVVLDVDALDGRDATLAKLAVETCQLRGMRTAQGLLRIAGIDLLPVPPGPPAATPAAGFRCTLGDLSVQGVHAVFVDEAVTPATTLEASLDSLTSSDLVLDAQRPDAVVKFAAALQVPGVMRSLQVDGQACPFAPRKTADVAVSADGICPHALKPYLDAIGVESLWKDGALRVQASAGAEVDASGRVSVDARLVGLDLRDGSTVLAVETLVISGASLEPAAGVARVESVELAGPDTVVRRDPGGALCFLGFRFGRPTPPPSAAALRPPVAVAASAPSSGAEQPPPRFEVGRLMWRSPSVRFEDETVQPPVVLTLSDAGLELTDLSVDLDPAAPIPAKPGHLKAWLSAPEVARKLEVDGTFVPRAGAVSLETIIKGEGITASALKPYLRAAGVEPVLADGSLALKLRVNLAQSEDKLTSSLEVQDLRYADGERELGGLDLLRVVDVTLASELTVGAVEVNRPRLTASRLADGDLVLAGVHLLPRGAGPATGAADTAPAPDSPPPPAATTLQVVRLRNASVAWTDQAVAPTVQTNATVDIDLDGLVLGRTAPPAQVKAVVRIADTIDQLTLTGTVGLSPDVQSARIEIDGAGLRAGPLAAYLPPSIDVVLAAGQLKTAIEASVARHPEGGQSASLVVKGLDWREGSEEASLFRMDSIRVIAPRLDLAGGVVTLDEVSVAGLESTVAFERAGRMRFMGVLLDPASRQHDTSPGLNAAVAPAQTDRAIPVATPQAAADATPSAAASRKPLPLVTVKNLNLGVSRLVLLDQTRPGVAPVIISDLRLHNPEAIELGGPDPAAQPPTRLQLTARCEPAAGKIDLALVIAPLAVEPNAQLDLAISGIDGQGILSLLPDAPDRIDSQMTDGTLKSHLEAQLKLPRRFPEDFNLSRGFELALLLKGLEFRAATDGPVLAGLESLQLEGAAVSPATGGAIVKALEVTKPIGRVYKDQEGLQALGFLLRPVAEVPAASQPAETPATAAVPDRGVQEAAAQTGRPAGEVRLERLLVSGIDLVLEDHSVDPPLIVPLTGLDVDARNLSNWASFEDRPVRFSVLVNSGKVELPAKPRTAGIAGALGDVAALVEGKTADIAAQYEQRELFNQITASGRLALHPKPSGWVKTSLSGLEMLGLKGEARRAGVVIGSGTFDGAVDLRMPGDGSIDVRSRLFFTDLTMSEPPDGPIVRFLHLSAPLDVVIKMLEGADGSITIPVRLMIEEGKVRGIAGAAAGALGSVIATAIASAPVKVVSGVTEVVGFLPTRRKDEPQPVALTFLPGAVGLEPAERAKLDALIRQLGRNESLELTLRHDLGAADVEMARARANPNPAQATMLAYQLRARKLELAAQCSREAGQTRALLASASVFSSSFAVERLRESHRELARTEDALDEVYELMRPGAELQAPRRTRRACLDLSRDRLQTVRTLLLASGIPDLAQRVRLTTPQVNPVDDQIGGKVTVTLVSQRRP